MKQTHTPGPWDILPLAHCAAIQAGPENRICTLWDHVELDGQPCGSIESQDKSQEEVNANAKLIAAAPDLLRACKRLLYVADQYSDYMAEQHGRGSVELVKSPVHIRKWHGQSRN